MAQCLPSMLRNRLIRLTSLREMKEQVRRERSFLRGYY
jgi:hypothetical protein